VYVDDDNSEETVESSAIPDLADWEGRVHSLEVWLSRGQAEVVSCLAFTWIAPAEVCANATSFIHSAIASVLPKVPVELLPPLGAAMQLRFATLAERELARNLSPINFQGAHLTLERPEETPNRFFRKPQWLARVAVVGYPPKHWHEELILRSFTVLCDIIEIDPSCHTTFDNSSPRLVLAVHHRLEIPREL
jgi:hypothetical protein